MTGVDHQYSQEPEQIVNTVSACVQLLNDKDYLYPVWNHRRNHITAKRPATAGVVHLELKYTIQRLSARRE